MRFVLLDSDWPLGAVHQPNGPAVATVSIASADFILFRVCEEVTVLTPFIVSGETYHLVIGSGV